MSFKVFSINIRHYTVALDTISSTNTGIAYPSFKRRKEVMKITV